MKKLNLIFDPFPALFTDRLQLRRPKLEDAKSLFQMRTDPAVMKYIGKPHMKSIEEAHENLKNSIESILAQESIEWIMTLKGKDELIGRISFWRIMKQHFRAEIGYTMHAEYFGKGYMSEAMNAALEYGFQNMNLHSIEANLDPNNIKSKSLLEKHHFVLEAHQKENFFFNNKFYDTLSYSLLKSKWENL